MDRSPVLCYSLDNGEIYQWVFPPSTGRQKEILHPKGCEGQHSGRHSVQRNLFININASLPKRVTTKTHSFCPTYTYPELTVCVNVVRVFFQLLTRLLEETSRYWSHKPEFSPDILIIKDKISSFASHFPLILLTVRKLQTFIKLCSGEVVWVLDAARRNSGSKSFHTIPTNSPYYIIFPYWLQGIMFGTKFYLLTATETDILFSASWVDRTRF